MLYYKPYFICIFSLCIVSLFFFIIYDNQKHWIKFAQNYCIHKKSCCGWNQCSITQQIHDDKKHLGNDCNHAPDQDVQAGVGGIKEPLKS